jgi:hypothetical protein
MAEKFKIGDLVQLYCMGRPQDKYYIVTDLDDIPDENEPPLYNLWCLNTGENYGWEHETHVPSGLYSFVRVEHKFDIK